MTQTKIEIQKQAVELLKREKRVILSWATGTGKSKVAIDAIQEIQPQRILLLVAETLHKDNWKDEFQKWNVELDSIFSQISIECYASLHKLVGTEWDMIIADEAHHAGSDLRLDYLNTIKTNYFLCLSATTDYSLIKNLESVYGKFKVWKISLDSAIKNNLLPEPKIYLIPLEFNVNSQTEEIIQVWGKKPKRKVIYTDMQGRWLYLKNKNVYPDVELHIKCNQYQKYTYLTEQFEYWKRIYMAKRTEVMKNKWLIAGNDRKRYLGTIKTPHVSKLLQTLQDKRYVCFCVDINQCDILGQNYAVHTKAENSDLNVVKFNNNEIDKLFFVGKGNEGMNFNNVEVGIIVQLSGQQRAPIQQTGRVLRSSEPVQYIFYYPGTRDEEFVNKFLENVDKKYVEIKKL